MDRLVFVAVFSFWLAGCDDTEGGAPANGFDTTEGVTLRPGALPHAVNWDASVGDQTIFPDAMMWVNDQLGVSGFVSPEEELLPTVVGAEGFVPAGSEYYQPVYNADHTPLVWVRLRWDAETGVVNEGYVLLNRDATCDRQTMVLAVAWGLLKTLGLADDPSVADAPESDSIMSNPLNVNGVLTPGDRELLDPYL